MWQQGLRTVLALARIDITVWQQGLRTNNGTRPNSILPTGEGAIPADASVDGVDLRY